MSFVYLNLSYNVRKTNWLERKEYKEIVLYIWHISWLFENYFLNTTESMWLVRLLSWSYDRVLIHCNMIPYMQQILSYIRLVLIYVVWLVITTCILVLATWYLLRTTCWLGCLTCLNLGITDLISCMYDFVSHVYKQHEYVYSVKSHLCSTFCSITQNSLIPKLLKDGYSKRKKNV